MKRKSKKKRMLAFFLSFSPMIICIEYFVIESKAYWKWKKKKKKKWKFYFYYAYCKVSEKLLWYWFHRLWCAFIWYWNWVWSFRYCNSRCKFNFIFLNECWCDFCFSAEVELCIPWTFRFTNWLKTSGPRVARSLESLALLKVENLSLPLWRIPMVMFLSLSKEVQLLSHFVS